jgi:hypothetical protein
MEVVWEHCYFEEAQTTVLVCEQLRTSLNKLTITIMITYDHIDNIQKEIREFFPTAASGFLASLNYNPRECGSSTVLLPPLPVLEK